MTLEEAAPDPAAPAASEADDARLWRAWREDGATAAREELFGLYFPFARQIARRHLRDRSAGDIELDDLVQLACQGLLEALDRYDPRTGTPFRAYASRRVSGAIVDGIAKMSELREQLSLRRRMHRERARSLGPSESAPKDALAALTELAVGLAMGFMLDASHPDPDDRPEAAANAYQSVAWKEAVAKVAAEVAELGERERTIIRRHYFDGLSFEQIADLLNLTKGRVSQLHRAALEQMRKRLGRSAAFWLKE